MTRSLEAPRREIDILRRGVELLRERLPTGWQATDASDETQARTSDLRPDAVMALVAADGTRARLILEAKQQVAARDMSSIQRQLSAVSSRLGSDMEVVPIFLTRYLPPQRRQWLRDHRISYIDATGNIQIQVSQPALYIRDRGADRDPWRGPGRRRDTLTGPPAASVVRALLDCAEAVTVPELAVRSGTSIGATYRVAGLLEKEGLVRKSPRGPIGRVNRRPLVERWSEDYGFQRSNSVRGYIQPGGLAAFLDDLRAHPELEYALTGSHAAARLASYAPARVGMLYLRDPENAESVLGLRRAATATNVLVACTDYDVVFDRLVEHNALRFVAPSQAAVDLLTAPGRGPEEGQALLDWMQSHEPGWSE